MKKLNKEIEDKAKTLNAWILQQDAVVEFKKYETLIKNNQELADLEKELKALQQEIVKLKHRGIDCQNIIQEYEKKKEMFDQNPIVYNYLMLKQEVNELVIQIQDDINQQLKKKVD